MKKNNKIFLKTSIITIFLFFLLTLWIMHLAIISSNSSHKSSRNFMVRKSIWMIECRKQQFISRLRGWKTLQFTFQRVTSRWYFAKRSWNCWFWSDDRHRYYSHTLAINFVVAKKFFSLAATVFEMISSFMILQIAETKCRTKLWAELISQKSDDGGHVKSVPQSVHRLRNAR